MKKIVDAPVAAGLPYSAGVVAAGLCFCAGQFGTDANDKPVGDVEAQTTLAIDHLEAVLQKAGTRLDLVVKVTMWLTTYDDFEAMNRAYRKRFPKDPPARLTLCVSQLLFGSKVEIEAIAVMP
jgi:2-iminobutanoate/2-iminopropanoate deaminase